ncbi:hypothetical protein R3P38DRAFT_2773193 [Favolaschia claudopus]|uniref:Uncharacterized protein n=1 Tax=Favolaschia claudopus TaxID=2862362 RepID=A0AAW0C4X4_9AGAR
MSMQIPALVFPTAQIVVCLPVVAATPSIAPKTKEPKEPKEKEPKVPGAGLPAGLVKLLRSGDEGPFTANEVFSSPPTQPLAAVEEDFPSTEWYAITRGRFVGVVDQYALADFAISGVAHYARKAYPTQAEAVSAFNKTLVWEGVQVI